MTPEQERAELLPCPFCGSTNIEIQISTPDREGVPTNLICSDCGASGPWEYEQGNSHAKADDAWNRRAALQSQEREDALRYRFIRSIVSASNARGRGSWQFHYDRLPMPLNNPMKGSVAQHFDEAIDYARRAEGES